MNINANHINYTRNGKHILNDISFEIAPSDRCAILGHNGSGKTSLFEVLTDTTAADSGTVRFDGKPFSTVKSNVGILWDALELFPYFSVNEAIKYIAALHKQRHSDYSHIYDILGLNKVGDTFVQRLSRGELQKLNILLSTMHHPQLLILDEPTTALDPTIQQLVWEKIFIAHQRTILFSSHQWDEAKTYANKVMFISNGRLLCPPQSPDVLQCELGLTQKIVLAQKTPLQGINVFGYESDGGWCYLVQGDHNIVDSVALQTHGFSVMPISLMDIYQYLIHIKS
ncbi:MAG: ABC transporter ATP-binding protein [Bacteroidales bacterium]|nr:ABC transporter ATP-binding protein [Bacteroidales bacterium]